MKQAPQCSLLFCAGQAKSLQETQQEQLSYNYSQQMTRKGPQTQPNSHLLSHSPKEIFSFKFKCFRNIPTTDKPNSQTSKNSQNQLKTQTKLISCRSTEKNSLKMVISSSKNHHAQHFFCSPPKKVELRVIKAQVPKMKTAAIYQSPTSFTHKSTLLTSMPSETYQSQADGKSKNSEPTQYSWQRSGMHNFYEGNSIGILTPQVNQFEGDKWEKWATKTQEYGSQKTSMMNSDGGETERTLIDCLKEDHQRNKQIPVNFNRDHPTDTSSYSSKPHLRLQGGHHIVFNNVHRASVAQALPNQHLYISINNA